MSVNWNWKYKKGYLVIKQGEHKYKINIYSGNCLGALIYDFKDEKTKKSMYQFYGFWNDETHLKRILGLIKGYTNLYKDNPCEQLIKIKLNVFYKDMAKIAPLFAKADFKVELYYKESK